MWLGADLPTPHSVYWLELEAVDQNVHNLSVIVEHIQAVAPLCQFMDHFATVPSTFAGQDHECAPQGDQESSQGGVGGCSVVAGG